MPSGASITVDGRKAPESGKTPIVVQLPPGEHILLAKLDGYHLSTRRIEVAAGKELPVEIMLKPLSKPCPALPPPCSQDSKSEALGLVELDNLHLHMGMLGAFGLISGRPYSGGPGVQAFAFFRRWIFGGHFLYFPWEEERIAPINFENISFTAVRPRWVTGQVEAGRVFPFRTSFIYTTLGIGASADRVVFVGKSSGDENKDFVKEAFSFVWSVGAGIEAMATRWLSLGVNVRLGLAHGVRIDKSDPTQESSSTAFPYGIFSGVVAFHL